MLERYPTTGTRPRSTSTRSSTRRSSTPRCASPTCSRASSTSSSASRRPTSRRSRSDKQAEDRAHHRARLPGHHHQHRQERPGAEEPARQGPARARGVRAVARPRRHRAGGDGRRGRRSATSGCAPSNAYYAKNVPIPKRDVARAKALLKEAGVPNPIFTLMTPTTSDAQRIAQVVQAMAQGGRLRRQDPGDRVRDLAQPGRQGRVRGLRARLERPRRPGRQPVQLPRLQAAAQLRGYCRAERDELLNQLAHARCDPAERTKIFAQIAAEVLKERPIIYLYHRNWLWAYNTKLTGMRTVPDGLVRVQGLKMQLASRQRAMSRFLLKRLAAIVPTLVFVSMLIFGLQQLLPGDPATILAGEDQDPQVIAYLRQKMHLDEPLPVRYALLDRRRGARRPRRVAAHPAAGAGPDRAEAAGDAGAGRHGDADRARDRHPGRHRLGGRQGHGLGLRRQRVRAVGPVDAEFLARHPDDPAVLGAARLAAGLGLRQPVRGPEGQPRGDDHAGLRARQRASPRC